MSPEPVEHSNDLLTLFRPKNSDGIGFLFHKSFRALSLDGEPDRLPVIPVRVFNLPSDKLACRHCWREAFLRSRNDGYVDIQASRLDLWECFQPVSLEELSDSLIPSSIVHLLESPLTAESLLLWFRCSNLGTAKVWAPALLRTLSNTDFQAVIQRLLADIDKFNIIKEVFEDDLWVASTLLEHHQVHFAVEPKHPGCLDETFDRLSQVDLGEWDPPPLGFAMTGALRRSIRPHKGPCVLATARDEAIYLIDWIAFHRSIGVEHFFIYTNHNSDGSDAILSALHKSNVITWVNSNPGKQVNPQRKSYLHALAGLPEILKYKWTAVIDIDEFIVLDHIKYKSLREFLALQEARGASGVGLNWIMMITKEKRWASSPIWERVTARDPCPNSLIKSIFLTNRAAFAHAHKPLWGHLQTDLFVNAEGQSRSWSATGVPVQAASVEHHAWISHYFYRSLEEFVWKNARDRNATFAGRGVRKFKPHFVSEWVMRVTSESSIEDDRALFWSDLAYNEAAQLRALPGVAGAEKEARDIFHRSIPDLVRDSERIVAESDLPKATKAAWAKVIQDYNDGNC